MADKDAREYDYEGDMAMSQLRSIIRNAQLMHDKLLEPNTNLPEWVQSKIILAKDYIETATNYLQSEMDEEYIEESTPGRLAAMSRKTKIPSEILRKIYGGHKHKQAKTPAAILRRLTMLRKAKIASGTYSEETQIDESASKGLAAKAKASGVSLSTLKTVYKRGVAAWNSGHRPGTTPQQWGMARVNSYIAKGKGTYHGADKDLREEESVDEACWDTHKQVGMKKKNGKMVPNCVPKEEVDLSHPYYKGLDRETAKQRKAHFERANKLSDRDPEAYKPAPGDKDAKTKPSVYTKLYHKKYGDKK